MKNIKNIKATLSFLTAISMLALVSCGDKNSESETNYVETTLSEHKEDGTVPPKMEKPSESTEKSTSSLEADSLSNTSVSSDLFSDRDLNGEFDSVTAEIVLNGDSVEVKGNGASADGSSVTITQEGVYRITGTLKDGQIIVDADKAKVQLVLDNADISCSTSSAIYIKDCDKTFITLAKDSKNTVSDGKTYTFEDETVTEPDSAIFSSDSLTINGTGELAVNGNYSDGIHSKDDIVITGGNITVNAVGDGIKGKDYVAVAGGNITVNAGDDGIKSTNTADASLGFVYIEGGTFSITAGGDGIQAETVFNATGGEVSITSGGGSSASTKTHTDEFGGMGGGMMRGGFNKDFDSGNFDPNNMPEDFNPEDFQNRQNFKGGMGGFNKEFESENTTAETSFTQLSDITLLTDTVDSSQEDDGTVSTKGIKAGTELNISGGTFSINSADDALHSAGTINISGGTVSIEAGDDGIHSDTQIDFNGGTVSITKSHEGIEAPVINVNDGVIELKSSDDGFNASDGSHNQMGQGVDGVALTINGGTVYVDSDGDGLDCNNQMYINGGTVIVNGPTNSGNGALDSETGINVTGGLVVAVGMSGMAEYPESSSSQNCVSATFTQTYDSGTLVTLTDSDGNELLSFESAKSFNNIVFSSPDLKDGVSYTFYTGGTSSADQKYGLYANGGYKNNGTESGSFTVESAVSFVGTQSMMGGGMGRGVMPDGQNGMGRGRMQFDQNIQPPTGENAQMPSEQTN